MPGVEHTRVTVDTPSGRTEVTVWEPARGTTVTATVVTVHPWATLGGSQANCVGVAHEMASAGLRALSFDIATASAVWGVLTRNGREVRNVASICEWASAKWGGGVVIFGSSAGAPIAGSVLSQVDPNKCRIAAFVGLGYTWGWVSSIAFGGHFGPLLRSTVPKLFIMGDTDEFTSVSTLRSAVRKAAGDINEVEIIQDAGHFELEQPAADRPVSVLALDFLRKFKLAGCG
jgi:alpha/beta superfamily hydrolase